MALWTLPYDPLSGLGSYLARARNNCRQRWRLVLPADSIEAGRIKVQGEAMPFDGKSNVRFDHDPDARVQAFQTFRGSAREAIAALDHLAALFDGGRRWLRNKECDEKGRFCLRGGIAHIAAGD
jgi:hypothetical protein